MQNCVWVAWYYTRFIYWIWCEAHEVMLQRGLWQWSPRGPDRDLNPGVLLPNLGNKSMTIISKF